MSVAEVKPTPAYGGVLSGWRAECDGCGEARYFALRSDADAFAEAHTCAVGGA